MPTFIPVIRKDTEASSARMSERIVVSAMREALAYERVAQAIAPFKTDGLVTGHKVLDTHEAVQILLKTAPDHLRNAIIAQKIRSYRLTQLLDRVLRAEFEMVGGKLTGKPSPRKLLQQQQAASAAAAPAAAPAEAPAEAPVAAE